MLGKAAYLENLACTGDWKGEKSCKGGGLTWLPGHPGHTVATPLCPQPRRRRGRPCRPGFGQGAGDSGKSSHPSPARLPEAWRGPETSGSQPGALGHWATLTVLLQHGLLLRQEAQALAPPDEETHGLLAGQLRPACGAGGEPQLMCPRPQPPLLQGEEGQG